MNRRKFLTGLIAAPLVVRPSILMPISSPSYAVTYMRKNGVWVFYDKCKWTPILGLNRQVAHGPDSWEAIKVELHHYDKPMITGVDRPCSMSHGDTYSIDLPPLVLS